MTWQVSECSEGLSFCSGLDDRNPKVKTSFMKSKTPPVFLSSSIPNDQSSSLKLKKIINFTIKIKKNLMYHRLELQKIIQNFLDSFQ